MTIQQTKCGASAVELRDDDGLVVATIYASKHGCVIMGEPGQMLECTIDMEQSSSHLAVQITRVPGERAA